MKICLKYTDDPVTNSYEPLISPLCLLLRKTNPLMNQFEARSNYYPFF